MSSHDVIIIGSGLAGSGMAAALSRRGWDVLLLERSHLPRHKVCGEFLSPESQASLWALGLHAAVAALAPAPMHAARLVSPAGASLQLALPGEAWGVSRYALDAALAEGAAQAGTQVQMGVTATDVLPDTTGAGCTVQARVGDQQHTYHARTAITACGRHPLPGLRPRAANSISTARQTSVGVKCHYVDITIPAQVELYLFPGGYAGLSPVEGGRVNLCLLTSRSAFTRAGASTEAMLTAAAHMNPALRQRLRGGRRVPGTSLAVAPVDTERVAVPWDMGARVGDAVTMIPPLCGDGMAMALRSAELCAPLAHEFLGGHLSLAEWEHCYRATWQREFAATLRAGRRLQAFLALPGIADALLEVGNWLPWLTGPIVQATRGRLRSLDELAAPVR